jgi:hypothetical protein
VKPRSLLVLLVVVLGLGAFVWFYERKLPSTEEAKAQEKRVLPGLEADEVREVTIVRGGTTVKLVREGAPPGPSPSLPPPAEWRLTAPLAARADRTAVDGLLSSLLALDKSRTLGKVDKKQYGLAPPEARVTLVATKGTRVLEVGRELPGTDQRAVALAGEPDVLTTTSSFWSDLAKAPGEWRSRELFPGSREDVERVSLQRGATKVILARRGEEPWIEAPLSDRADGERFDALLDALTGLQVVEFLDQPPGPPATLGLEPPAEVVEVVRKGQARPFRIELGASHGEGEAAARYARADGQLVTLEAPPLDEAAARSPQDWRSRSWTTFAVYDVEEAVIKDGQKDGQGPLTLTRADADWKRGAVKIFYGTVSDLLGALTDAKAERVLDPAEAQGLATGPPVLTLELVGSGGKRQTLTLWAPLEGATAGAPARTSGRDAVLLLPAGTPADLAAKIAAVRKAKPLEEEPTPTPAP